MAKVSSALFANALSVFNINRYTSTDPDLAARFENLTPELLVISDVVVDTPTNSITAKVEAPSRSWSGTGQQYTRAKLLHPKITVTEDLTLEGVTDQESFLEAITHIETAGVYRVLVPELGVDTYGILVVHPPIPAETLPEDVDEVTGEAVFTQLTTKLEFTYANDKVIVKEDDTFRITDNYLNDAVYHAPVGQAEIVIPATNYGALDNDTYMDAL